MPIDWEIEKLMLANEKANLRSYDSQKPPSVLPKTSKVVEHQPSSSTPPPPDTNSVPPLTEKPKTEHQATAPVQLQVFLCHGKEDKPAVRELYKRLKEIGVKPWLDEVDLLPGQDWKREITKAVRGSDIVIVCLSRTSVSKTGFVQKEIKYALDVADEKPEGSIYIIPARLEHCDVPERLSDWQWVDLFDISGHERLISSFQIALARSK